MFPFRSLPPSFRFASSFPCVTSVPFVASSHSFQLIGSYGMPLQEVSLQTIWSWKMLKESQGNPTRSWRNPNKNYKMLEKSNPILRDIWFFLEISQRALHTINSKSTEETGSAEGKLEVREHVKATRTWKPKKIQKNWKKLEKTTKSWKILTKA